MVVASSWSEQRVLMRAFAASADQTRPTINLHGAELSIGPAGTEPHGQWGIHVEPPVDGRAQELRAQLELAARRLAGSKGNPPRLQDEASEFEGKATNLWAPGTPADEGKKTVFGHSGRDYYEPAEAAAASAAMTEAAAASAAAMSARSAPPNANLRRTPPFWSEQEGGGQTGRRNRRKTDRFSGAMPVAQPPGAAPGNKTVHGFSPRAPEREAFARYVSRTMPLGFALEERERTVLNALGQKRQMSAAEVAALLGVDDPVEWMEKLMEKLGHHGLDVVVPGTSDDGQPSYKLRR
jgi:hypothetical protein